MSNKGPYDKDLLASAPAATKAQLQEGYTTDLLDPNHGKTSSPHLPQSEQSPLAPQADAERSVSPGKELNGYVSSTKPVPFWRTSKGIIIIIVAILVVLGAVIGGAVGGTRTSKKNNQVTSNNGTTPNQTTNQGVGSAPPTSTIPTTTSGIISGGGQGVSTKTTAGAIVST